MLETFFPRRKYLPQMPCYRYLMHARRQNLTSLPTLCFYHQMRLYSLPTLCYWDLLLPGYYLSQDFFRLPKPYCSCRLR